MSWWLCWAPAGAQRGELGQIFLWWPKSLSVVALQKEGRAASTGGSGEELQDFSKMHLHYNEFFSKPSAVTAVKSFQQH